MAPKKQQSATKPYRTEASNSKSSSIVLVGTYRKDQLKKWILPKGLYNYPIHAEDTAIKAAAPNVRELWLYAGKTDKLRFSVRFDREVSADDLDTLGYPRGKEKPHSDRYLLFKVAPVTDEGKSNRDLGKSHAKSATIAQEGGTTNPNCSHLRILVRLTDFKRSPMRLAEIRKAAAASEDKKSFSYLDFLPEDLVTDWGNNLCVCEEALQLRFWDIPELSALRPYVPFPPPEHPKFTFVDLFAGMGGFRIAMQAQGGKCVFSSEWNPFAQKTYEANFGDIPYGDITKEETKSAIPKQFDVLCAGFPCQPFSIAGVSKKKSLGRETGFRDKTQGTLFFDVADIISRHRPKAFFLENVKNLVSHDRGNTFRVICETLEELDYSIHYRVMDGQAYVPQHRERIMIVGFDRKRFHGAEMFDFPELPQSHHAIRDILLPHPDPKYTLTDKLWQYLQKYARHHQEKGNGFGFGMTDLGGVSRTLSARYYKDGSEILIPQGEGVNPRRLAPRECARLMGYPDNYDLSAVSEVQAYRQCGNSVIVPLITAVSGQIVKALLSHE